MENKQQIWDEYLSQGGEDHPNVRHMFLDYSRYYEARLIKEWFDGQGGLGGLRILDYGCGVGDYGLYFLRNGATKVDMYDFPRASNLVQFRLDKENLEGGRALNADKARLRLDLYDVVIFGEVLEHLPDPAALLAKLVKFGTKYIFTSSYPYRSDDPTETYWQNHDHDQNARLQMPECRKILEDNYKYEKFDGELRLWHK
jgi:2-polyprenyl-3-methyl-5-hydroxy-6-metoxy-1,4-benzoquinol methylase